MQPQSRKRPFPLNSLAMRSEGRFLITSNCRVEKVFNLAKSPRQSFHSKTASPPESNGSRGNSISRTECGPHPRSSRSHQGLQKPAGIGCRNPQPQQEPVPAPDRLVTTLPFMLLARCSDSSIRFASSVAVPSFDSLVNVAEQRGHFSRRLCRAADNGFRHKPDHPKITKAFNLQ
jgi:hypothetical protein